MDPPDGILEANSDRQHSGLTRFREYLTRPRADQDLPLIPFVGAGLSVPYGYPGWEAFIKDVAKLVKDPAVKRKIDAALAADKPKPITAAELIVNARTHDFNDAVKNRFGPERYTDTLERFARPIDAVRWLPILGLSPLVTTNFDPVLERIYERAGVPLAPFKTTDLDAFKTFRAEARGNCLVKLHGSFDAPFWRVMAGHEYDIGYGDDGHVVKMLGELATKGRFLFLGCSLQVNGDRPMEALANLWKALGKAGNHFALVQTDLDMARRYEELAERGIQAIFYPAGEYWWIEEFLRWVIVERVDPRLGRENGIPEAHTPSGWFCSPTLWGGSAPGTFDRVYGVLFKGQRTEMVNTAKQPAARSACCSPPPPPPRH